MYRKIFKAESKKDLLVELPAEYLNKQVEVIAFQVADEGFDTKKMNAKKAVDFFNTIEVDMSNFKFDRNEANDQYWNRLSKAVTDIEEGKGITVSMEELDIILK